MDLSLPEFLASQSVIRSLPLFFRRVTAAPLSQNESYFPAAKGDHDQFPLPRFFTPSNRLLLDYHYNIPHLVKIYYGSGKIWCRGHTQSKRRTPWRDPERMDLELTLGLECCLRL
jgi:hypothetical protein